MIKQTGIYAIYCFANGKVYVGQAQDIIPRWKEHQKNLREQTHHNRNLQLSWINYGPKSFILIGLEGIDCDDEDIKEELNNSETRWMSSFESQGYTLFNDCPTGFTNLGLIHTTERRRTKSISQGGKNHWNYGRHWDEETRKKMSESHIGLTNPCRGTGRHPVIQISLDGKIIKRWGRSYRGGDRIRDLCLQHFRLL